MDGLPSKDVIGTSPPDGDSSALALLVSAPVVALTTAPPVFFAKKAKAAAFAASTAPESGLLDCSSVVGPPLGAVPVTVCGLAT